MAGRRRRHQKAETIDVAAFLRPRCERPGGRRTSNYLDEVASSHLPPQGYGLRRLGMRDYSRVFRSAEWGSEVSCKAAILNRSCRLPVKSGHDADMTGCPLSLPKRPSARPLGLSAWGQ